jgi:tRNA threonylcarbamoyladenosine biosynthesis protein TsaE
VTAEPSVHESESPQQTERIAAELAANLRPGDVVFVTGEVGAGKTTFVRGACRALGVTGRVTSPTFTIGRRYEGAGVAISHLDLHRIADLDAEDPGLLADYIGPGRIAFVEWPEVAAGMAPNPAARVAIAHRGGDARRIEVRR